MRATEAVGEARRVMEICNACRYCEGYLRGLPGDGAAARVRRRRSRLSRQSLPRLPRLLLRLPVRAAARIAASTCPRTLRRGARRDLRGYAWPAPLRAAVPAQRRRRVARDRARHRARLLTAMLDKPSGAVRRARPRARRVLRRHPAMGDAGPRRHRQFRLCAGGAGMAAANSGAMPARSVRRFRSATRCGMC